MNRSWWQKVPSWGWVFILVGGLIVLIGTIMVSFFALATVEGVASAIFLIIALASVFHPGWKRADSFAKATPSTVASASSSLIKGMAICFFALMGMAIDQPGNYLFNLPLQHWCPAQTFLRRTVNVSHPLPGRTDLTQDFACVNSGGRSEQQVPMGAVIGVRFVEYVVLVYVLLGVRNVARLMRVSFQESPETVDH